MIDVPHRDAVIYGVPVVAAQYHLDDGTGIAGVILADHARISRLVATVESVVRHDELARAPRVLNELWDRTADLLELACGAEEGTGYDACDDRAASAPRGRNR